MQLRGSDISGRKALLLTALAALVLAALLCPAVNGQVTQVRISSGHDHTAVMTARQYEQQGMALMAQKNWSGMIAIASEGIAAYPQDAELYCLRGYASRKIGRYGDAVNDTTIGIDLDHRPARYANRGFALLALGRYQDAIRDADAAISLNASYPSSYAVKAMALAGMGNLSGADAAIGTGLGLDPANPFFWQLKGEILARSGNCTGARESFETSLLIKPDNDEMPWPGLPNASVDLSHLDSSCPAGTPSPAPTRAVVPAGLAIVALAIGVYLRDHGTKGS